MRSLPNALCCLAVVGSLACGEDPQRTQARAYLTAMRPVLYENALLAEQVLLQGAAVHDGKATPASILATWDADVTPLAYHVATLADQVASPDYLTSEHAGLVDLWTSRAEAYRGVSEGLHTENLDLFTSSQKEAAAVTLREDEWVRALNAKLSKMDLFVDLVP